MVSPLKTENKRVQPVVAVVGHIDHGKTSLLDYIRKSKVAEREHGGITQRISAYEIEHQPTDSAGSASTSAVSSVPNGSLQAGSPQAGSGQARAITFIDTPGHEAFQKMRRRGASAADIAILVIAADDGVKPQTKEAWSAISDAGIPFIVAFTKIDKDTANLDRAKESVLKEGIYLEGLGGTVPHVAVSSKSGAGIPDLLDLILLVADLEDIHCDSGAEPRAIVIESSRDPKSGISATVIVRDGIFHTGVCAVADDAWAPLRIIEDANGEKVKEIACGKPAKITGFSKEPRVGSELVAVKTKKEAEKLASQGEKPRIEASPSVEDRTPVRLILKADTTGSLEALEYELKKIPQENACIIIADKGVGSISENDVKQLIGFDDALIAGFNVKIDASAKDLAERQGVRIETKPIIYELTEWLKEEVKRIAPDTPETVITGSAKIIKHFSDAGSKHVVGGKVQNGVLTRGSHVTINRRGVDVGVGKIINLQSQKADVESVSEGVEFGAQIDTKADITGGDVIETSHTA